MDMQAKYARWAAQDRKMQLVGKVTFWAALAVVALTLYMAWDQDRAMKQCQAKGYSFDTCFSQLHR